MNIEQNDHFLSKFLVSADNKLKEVMGKIDSNGHGVALVVNKERKLLGLVTDGDIRRAIINGEGINTPITTIMNESPAAIKENYSPEEVTNTIKGKPINNLPILNEEGVVCNLLLREELHKIVSYSSNLFPKKNFDKEHKKILVVGGAGFVGSVLTRQLLDKGYSVRVLDKFLFGESSIEELKQNEKFSLVKGDIGHVEVIIEAIKDVDAVVHLAEIVGDPACALDPEKTQQINYLSTSLVASICKHFQLNRFIYTSSCSVYGASQKGELLSENSELNPVSLYARMKIESEKHILNMSDSLFCPTILRLATVFGESPRMRFDLVVNTLTAKAIREGKITLFGGDQWRPNVHVSDVAKAIITVLEAPVEKVKGEVFNVGSEENNLTINQIGKLIKENIPAAELLIEERDIDKRDYKVSFSKINQVLGFKNSLSVVEGIKEVANSLRAGKYENHCEDVYYNDRWYKIANKFLK
jgi:nucleoside-diphosphate-sugar epimerase